MSKLENNIYETIFVSAPIGITILDNDGYIVETNATFLEQFGVLREEVIQKHHSDIFEDTINDQFNVLLDMIETSKLNFIKDVLVITRNDTEHLIIEISLSKIDKTPELENKFIMISEDITNQQDTHAALLQSEKLALTGRLAASLAHEINNPLQTAVGCLGLAEEMLNDDDKKLSIYIKMAIEELQRSARIVKKLRDLNRKTDSLDKASVDIEKLLGNVIIFTKNRLYDKKIVPVFLYEGPVPLIYASKDQIQQVLLNLIMNAIDAIPDGGNIYFDILHTKDPEGISVKVRDTGTGMNPEVLNNLFNPFFTTKEDGLGLGLYICKNIIEDHDGSMQVNSEPGKGTEFCIWLPGFTSHKQGED